MHRTAGCLCPEVAGALSVATGWVGVGGGREGRAVRRGGGGGGRETEKREGREEEESEGWKELQAVECKRCSFPRLPILLLLERVHSPLRGRSLLVGEGWGEGGAGRSRHEQRHV